MPECVITVTEDERKTLLSIIDTCTIKVVDAEFVLNLRKKVMNAGVQDGDNK